MPAIASTATHPRDAAAGAATQPPVSPALAPAQAAGGSSSSSSSSEVLHQSNMVDKKPWMEGSTLYSESRNAFEICPTQDLSEVFPWGNGTPKAFISGLCKKLPCDVRRVGEESGGTSSPKRSVVRAGDQFWRRCNESHTSLYPN